MLLNLNVPVNHLEILFDGDSDLVGLHFKQALNDSDNVAGAWTALGVKWLMY